MSKVARFHVHRHIAKEMYAKHRILDKSKFEEVEWRLVWSALKEAPRMFQVWASKQVMNIAGVNRNLAKYKKRHSTKKCPSCNRAVETCDHVLICPKEGRVKNLHNSL